MTVRCIRHAIRVKKAYSPDQSHTGMSAVERFTRSGGTLNEGMHKRGSGIETAHAKVDEHRERWLWTELRVECSEYEYSLVRKEVFGTWARGGSSLAPAEAVRSR